MASADLEEFVSDFESWKKGDEYGSYIFGKDSAYIKPQVSGASNALKHVHLVPAERTEARRKWDQQWRRKGRKTSDRVLVYAEDPTYGYLLIFILDEPTAHRVAQMRIEAHKTAMYRFRDIATNFVTYGTTAAAAPVPAPAVEREVVIPAPADVAQVQPQQPAAPSPL